MLQFLSKSVSISSALYDCDWFEADLRFKKMMIVTMMRAIEPEAHTGLGFFVVSSETFKMVGGRFCYLFEGSAIYTFKLVFFAGNDAKFLILYAVEVHLQLNLKAGAYETLESKILII